MKVCAYCKKEYKNIYTKHIKYKYKYTKPTTFCSKSCAGLSRGDVLTRELVEGEVVDFVLKQDRYCSKVEILRGINRSSKTLTKFGVKISEIQCNLGLSKAGSIFANEVHGELKKVFDNIVCEKTFDDMLSPKGYNLRLDFFIEDLGLIVEADGAQHYDPNNPWYSEYQYECDQIKNAYAIENNLTMVRLPYTKNVNADYLFSYIDIENLELWTGVNQSKKDPHGVRVVDKVLDMLTLLKPDELQRIADRIKELSE